MDGVGKCLGTVTLTLVFGCSSDDSAAPEGQAGAAASSGGAIIFGNGGSMSGGSTATGGTGTGGTGGAAGSGGVTGSGGQGGVSACPAGQVQCNGVCLSPGMSQDKCTVLLQTTGIGGLALDATNVYFSQGGIYLFPKAGGAARMVAGTEGAADAVAVNATHFFWIEERGFTDYVVHAIPKAGGASSIIATHNDQISGLRASDSRVFFLKTHFGAPSDVASVTIDGQNPLQYGTSDESHDCIVLDEPNLYWGDSPFNQPGGVWMSPQSSVSAQRTATADSVYYPVLGGGSIFFYDSLKDGLYSVAKTGGTAAPVLVPPMLRFADPYLFGDGTHVFWLSNDGFWSVGLDGKNPASVVRLDSVSYVRAGLARGDASGVYFVVGFFLLRLTP